MVWPAVLERPVRFDKCAEVRVFDVYRGQGVPEGQKSVAIEVEIQPRVATLTEAEIEALTAKVVAAAAKAGGVLRS